MSTFLVPQNPAKLSEKLNAFVGRLKGQNLLYGISDAEMEQLESDAAWLEYTVRHLYSLRATARATTVFRNRLLYETGQISSQTLIVNASEPPPGEPKAGVAARLRKAMQRIKAQEIYTDAFGASLGMFKSASPTLSAPLETKPKGRAATKNSSQILIKWRKGAFEGLLIQSMRGDETNFSDLDRDFFPPYIDTRPPLVAGQSELRRYRLIYLIKDKPYGVYSDVLQIWTTP